MYKGCLKLLVQIISLVSRIFFVFFKKPKLLLFRAVLFFYEERLPRLRKALALAQK